MIKTDRLSILATLAFGLGCCAFVFTACTRLQNSGSLEGQTPKRPGLISKSDIAASIGEAVAANQLPEYGEFRIANLPVKAKLKYALEPSSQEYILKLLQTYRPDFAAFVALDAETGRILSLASTVEVKDSQWTRNTNLALKSSFPAASVFKVVTASAVLDTKKVTPDTEIAFNGANHTLYKRNIASSDVNRWTRRITLKDAFASSINTVFGKLGVFYAGAETLKDYANRFAFNREIRADIPVQPGSSRFSSDDPWSVASAASGFTLENKMSPLQGALIAATIANDGKMMEPYLVEQVLDAAGAPIYQVEPLMAQVAVAPEAAASLRQLFAQTVHSGTSRKAFRKALRKRNLQEVEFGGKTGSLTGTEPRGKCDWFVGYARYGNRKIAVSALTVNQERWKIKSSSLAEMYLTHYIQNASDSKIAEK